MDSPSGDDSFQPEDPQVDLPHPIAGAREDTFTLVLSWIPTDPTLPEAETLVTSTDTTRIPPQPKSEVPQVFWPQAFDISKLF